MTSYLHASSMLSVLSVGTSVSESRSLNNALCQEINKERNCVLYISSLILILILLLTGHCSFKTFGTFYILCEECLESHIGHLNLAITDYNISEVSWQYYISLHKVCPVRTGNK